MDDNISVEEIMEKIRKNIRHQKSIGELPQDPDRVISTLSYVQTGSERNEASRLDLAYINSNWDIHNNSYFISSHRLYFGKILVKGRQLVHGEVRRYVDPVISRQTEFNAGMVRILNETSQKLAETDRKFSQQLEELNRNFSRWEDELSRKISLQEDELNQKISRQKEDLTADIKIYVDKNIYEFFLHVGENPWVRKELACLLDEINQKISEKEEELTRKISQQEEDLNINIQNYIDKNLDEVVSRIDNDLRLRMGLAHLFEERIKKELAQKITAPEPVTPTETNYFLFEERFRGTRKDIKERQLAFLPYFENCSRVLDIGCGRGEFLEILKNNHIGGIGVDLDADMVKYCESHQLDVVQSDALSYMESLENKSLDGIFIDQVVEHLEPAYLVRLLVLCHQKLKYGYHLVVETVNPLSFVSLVNFYIDLTHKRPVHPETLQYLISAAGFRVCETKFFSPVSDEKRLKNVEGSADMNENERKNVDAYNHNVEMLNTVLFGAQDYAIVGKK